MQSTAKTAEEYLDEIPEERKQVMIELRKTIKKNLPKGFQEVMNYGMMGYVVPYSLYKPGYHCNPQQPLPFINLANQKNFIALYHMGIYGDPKLLDWFTKEYGKVSAKKLDMGKSCIRFKKPEDVPLQLIGELCKKMTPQDWINMYEQNLKK